MFLEDFIEMFSFGFMIRALLCGVSIALAGALVGVPLVLKKNAMLTDGLSHTAFAAFVVAATLGVFGLEIAIPLVVVISFLILRLNENNKINGDLAIALISTTALALGVFLVSFYGVNIDINSYLFGSILGTSQADVILAVLVAILTTIIYIVCYNQIFALSFDEKFAKAIGVKITVYRMMLAALCSVVIVIGMKLVGALLISGLILFPTLTARYLATSFKSTVLLSVVIAILNFLVGFILSYLISAPTGATIVLTSLGTLLLVKIIDKMFNIMSSKRPR